MQRGESTWNDRTHVVLTRNGFPEETWFTWSYSPIQDSAGKVAGMHCVAIEETPRVLAEKSRERLSDKRLRQEADARARTILESIPPKLFLDREWRFRPAASSCRARYSAIEGRRRDRSQRFFGTNTPV